MPKPLTLAEAADLLVELLGRSSEGREAIAAAEAHATTVYTPAEVAELLKLTGEPQDRERKVLRLCREGKLPGARKAGRSWRIPAGAIAAFFAPPPEADSEQTATQPRQPFDRKAFLRKLNGHDDVPGRRTRTPAARAASLPSDSEILALLDGREERRSTRRRAR